MPLLTVPMNDFAWGYLNCRCRSLLLPLRNQNGTFLLDSSFTDLVVNCAFNRANQVLCMFSALSIFISSLDLLCAPQCQAVLGSHCYENLSSLWSYDNLGVDLFSAIS
jgi:hypothetical protein